MKHHILGDVCWLDQRFKLHKLISLLLIYSFLLLLNCTLFRSFITEISNLRWCFSFELHSVLILVLKTLVVNSPLSLVPSQFLIEIIWWNNDRLHYKHSFLYYCTVRQICLLRLCKSFKFFSCDYLCAKTCVFLIFKCFTLINNTFNEVLILLNLFFVLTTDKFTMSIIFQVNLI